MSQRNQVAIFGAAARTPNLGVSALLSATVSALTERGVDRFVVFGDHDTRDPGRPRYLAEYDAEESPARWSRKVWSSDSLANMLLYARLRVPAKPDAPVTRLRQSCAALDVSGGDSFTDLYNEWRFRWICRAKEAAIAAGVPLILLPQTYGPYLTQRTKVQASRIVRRARLAYARDERSFGVLRELLGSDYDPARHKCGVDMAFLLKSIPPQDETLARSIGVLASRAGADTPVIGLNVSGLIWKNPDGARTRYGFRADYRESLVGFLREALRRTGATVVLVPHVSAPLASHESDLHACQELHERIRALAPESSHRVTIAPLFDDPREVKWLIAQLDWFCGTRMHSTIASLSSGVPTGAVSYSPKTLGVFESCAQGEHVADPTTLDTDEVAAMMWRSFERRDEARESLASALPGVLAQARAQMDDIVSVALGTPHTAERPRIDARRMPDAGAPAA